VIILLVVMSILINLLYLISFRLLMDRLSSDANDYWEAIGRPNSFSVSHSSSLLSALYRKEMTMACHDTGCASLLKRVRLLLPLGMLINLLTFVTLAKFLSSQ